MNKVFKIIFDVIFIISIIILGLYFLLRLLKIAEIYEVKTGSMEDDIHVGDYICTVEYDYPEFYLTMHCFLCDILSGELTLLEHEDAKWLGKDDIWSVDWLPADIEVIKELEKRL